MRDHNKIAVNTTYLYHRYFKVLGVLVAKAATTSTTSLFRDSYGFKRSREKYWDYEKVKDAWSFAFVRNPWDRLVSTYHNKVEHNLEPCFKRHPDYNIKRGMTFTSFIQQIQKISQPTEWWDIHIRPQWYSVCNWRAEIVLDYIGKFENYTEDIRHIQRHMNLELILPPVANKTNRNDYQFYYNHKTRSIVEEIYAKDIELFDYKF